MPRTIRTKVYKYEELNEKAKEKARDWYRAGNFEWEWWDFVEEDLKEIGDLMGIDIDKAYFSGFSSQGDGACFEGTYRAKKDIEKCIREYAPLDEKLHSIAAELDELAKYKLHATIKHSGHYYHEYCTSIDVSEDLDDTDEEMEQEAFSEVEGRLITALRDLMRWYYKQLEANWDYINSDENVADTIIANEYEFTIDGKRF